MKYNYLGSTKSAFGTSTTNAQNNLNSKMHAIAPSPLTSTPSQSTISSSAALPTINPINNPLLPNQTLPTTSSLSLNSKNSLSSIATSLGLNNTSLLTSKNSAAGNLLNVSAKDTANTLTNTNNLNKISLNQTTSKDSIIIPASASRDTNSSVMMNVNDVNNLKRLLELINGNTTGTNTASATNSTAKLSEGMSLEALQSSDQVLQKMQQLLTLENTIQKVEQSEYTINDIMNSDSFYSQIQSLVDLKKMQLEQLLKKAKPTNPATNPTSVTANRASLFPTPSANTANPTPSSNTTANNLLDLSKLQELLNQNKGQNQEQVLKQLLQLINSQNASATGSTVNNFADRMDQDITTSSLNASSLLTMNNLTNSSLTSMTPSTVKAGFGYDGSFNDSIIMSDYITPITNNPGSGASSMNLTNSPIAGKKGILGDAADDGMKIDSEDSATSKTIMNNYLNLSFGATTAGQDLTLSNIAKTKMPSLVNPPFHLPGITTLDSSTNTSTSGESSHNVNNATTDYNYLLSLSGNNPTTTAPESALPTQEGGDTSATTATTTSNSLLSNPLVREHMDFFSEHDLFNSINYSFIDDY